MVLRGSIRGNGSQLADYLLTQGANDSVRVFDIRGTSQPDNLKKSLIEMSLTAELSGRTKKGLYHVVINPRIGEDRQMSDEEWHRAAEIIEIERGFTGQKRAMVMHKKAGRLHLHVAWERYDHDTGRMICNKHAHYSLKRARQTIEQELHQERTADRNEERPALKLLLKDLWAQYPTGSDFIAAAKQQGYTIAKQSGRRPYVIVNKQGRSFDLAKELSGVRTTQIREKLLHLPLLQKEKVRQAAINRKGRKKTREQLANEIRVSVNQKTDRSKDKGR